MRQHPAQGIAIISALFMMVMVLGIGIGSVFLLQNNLRIAENSRSQTVAFYAAETAIEVARGQLQAHLDAGNTTLPATLTLQPVQSAAGVNYSFALDGYATRNGGTEAVLDVLGFGPNDGEHASVVVLGSAPAAQDPPDPRNLYGAGFISEGVVNLAGNPGGIIDARIHGNAGFSLAGINSGSFFDCLEREPNAQGEPGRCISRVTRAPVNNSSNLVTAATGQSSYACKATGISSVCSGRGNSKTPAMANRVDPVDIDVDVLGVRNNNSSVYDENGNKDLSVCDNNPVRNTDISSGSWSGVTSGLTDSNGDGKVVFCSQQDITLGANDVVEDIKIYSAGNVTFSGSATIEDAAITADGNLDLGSANVANSFLYGNTMNDISNSATINDADPDNDDTRIGTTIATPDSITFNGSTTANVAANGDPVVSMAVYSGGEIRFNGSSKTYAVFFSEDKFRFNGSATLYGSVYTKGEIDVNGSGTIDAGVGISNQDAGGGNNNQRRIVDAISRR
ncbi:MAG: pilus assembly PilX N-terminal domain-containing protein [Trueperaceae bacterium]|nr:pilus assembly PilX N-terminal domain-containing protein [Trueperaceae bacterium]